MKHSTPRSARTMTKGNHEQRNQATDDSGYEGAMNDAGDIASRIMTARGGLEAKAV